MHGPRSLSLLLPLFVAPIVGCSAGASKDDTDLDTQDTDAADTDVADTDLGDTDVVDTDVVDTDVANLTLSVTGSTYVNEANALAVSASTVGGLFSLTTAGNTSLQTLTVQL